MKKTIQIALISSIGILTVSAQENEYKKSKRPSAESIFNKLDADEDGFITLAELKLPPHIKDASEEAKAKFFSKLDSNSDEQVTLEEFEANKPKKGKKK